MKNLDNYIVSNKTSIREAIKQLDYGGIGFLVIVSDAERVEGVLTDGDFRRAILDGIKLDEPILKISNTEFLFLKSDFCKNDAENIFKDSKVKHIPILKDGKLFQILTEDVFFNLKKESLEYNQIHLPIVIMAGGKGTRMDPFTRILPKPLIPIGNRAMLEVIMDEYAKFGMKQFYLSINHMGKMIKAYLEDHESDYAFEYITEDKPLGTAGALKYLEGKINTPFFVSNCDIIIKDDYSKIYDFHLKGNYALTMVASMQHYTVPYGVCEIENGGELKTIVEKPQYDFLLNTGMYLLNPEVLEFIPKNEFFHITDLIEKLKEKGHKIGVFPVSEKSYYDVGQWDEYKKSLRKLNTETE